MKRVTEQLIIANIAVYVLQKYFGFVVTAHFALWPIGSFSDGRTTVGFEPWQLITYAFLHDTNGIAHIGFNMFTLWMFGREVEGALGSRRFLYLYIASVLTAGITQLIVMTMTLGQDPVPTLGASGGVFGVLLAFGMLFPKRRVMLVFPPIPMPAWVLVAGYGAIELANGVFRTQDGVAHFAHLGGMVGAFIVLFTLARQRR
jgi:membrane associated rhomboid family serine protease